MKRLTTLLAGAGHTAIRLRPGINTWPATAAGAIVFASTRNARRLQRDPTQQIFLLPPPLTGGSRPKIGQRRRLSEQLTQNLQSSRNAVFVSV